MIAIICRPSKKQLLPKIRHSKKSLVTKGDISSTSTTSVLNNNKGSLANGRMIGSNSMITTMKSWPKIRRGKSRSRLSEPNCSRPDCKPLRKMLTSSIGPKRTRRTWESKRNTNFHHSTSGHHQRSHLLSQLHQPTLRLIHVHPHIQQLSTSTLWRLLHHSMMIFWMSCLQIRNTRPMHAALSRRGEHRWSRTSSETIGAMLNN